MNTSDVSTRLSPASANPAYAARVEVQHPGVPWANKVVVRLYVRDASVDGVAAAVRDVAGAAATDPDVKNTDLTFIAYGGSPGPENYDSLWVMGSVSERIGVGKGVEDILELSAADIRTLALQG